MSKDNGGPASDKIQQARRAAFEKWWTEVRKHKQPEKFNNGDYCSPSVYNAWNAFNAALDCVVIELPLGGTGIHERH